MATKEERRLRYALRIWLGWRGRLHQIDREIDGLARERRTMQYALERVIRPNERIMNHPNRRYLNDVWRWYGLSMGIAVRRLVDTDPRTKSLVVFLKSILAHRDAFSIDVFSQVFPASNDDLRQLISPVADASGEALNAAAIELDLDTLFARSRRISKWVNDHVAHGRYFENAAAQIDRDRNVPIYQELHDALDAIQDVSLKYARIFLKHDRLPYSVAEVDADLWLSLFEFPWIKAAGQAQNNG